MLNQSDKDRGNLIVGEPFFQDKCNIKFHGKNGKIIFGKKVRLINVNINIYSDAEVVIGDDVTYRGTINCLEGCVVHLGNSLNCNGYLNISAAEKSRIIIGDECLVSAATLRSSDMHGIFCEKTHARINKAKDIVIGRKVWLAQDVFILKGVCVGDNSVIAARAVVAKDVPSGCIAAGNPAKIVRENIYWKNF